MKYIRWNFDNRPEGFERIRIGVFGGWEQFIVLIHVLFIGSIIALAWGCALEIFKEQGGATFIAIGVTWLVASLPFVFWLRARYQNRGA